ncbi:thioredoxin domain-containing protein, partial [Microbacteriaceae bacterium K1510]|nr:thioredoxin domain-containing protein [Microbacteriaceae bacterium K1510]
FEDDEVAAFLNEHFVSIKVDREERPDVDHIYMTVCQAMTGQGGWPLTIVMTPDCKPFFAGTYFPKESKWGRPGLMDTLKQLAAVWTHDRERIENRVQYIMDKLE